MKSPAFLLTYYKLKYCIAKNFDVIFENFKKSNWQVLRIMKTVQCVNIYACVHYFNSAWFTDIIKDLTMFSKLRSQYPIWDDSIKDKLYTPTENSTALVHRY